MDEFRFTLRLFMIILIIAGIIAGVIGVFLANYALIVAGAILMSVPLILKIINDMILEEWILAFFEFLGLCAIGFLYIWTSIITSGETLSVIDNPVLWVVGGVGIIQLLLFIFVFKSQY